MTRAEKLYSMNGALLIGVADKLGVKVACNKTRNQLKEAKAKVIERILAAEAELETEEPELVPMPGADKLEELKKETQVTEEKDDQPIEQPKPKRGALIEFDGKAQNICKWGEELGISPNTLYGRIYKMGWSVERAFTTPARKGGNK